VLHPHPRGLTSGTQRAIRHQLTGLPGGGPGLPCVHRALRLVVAAGTATAGVCLVVGMTALVVKFGAVAPRSAAGPVKARQTGDLTASRETPSPARARRHLIPGAVIAAYHGAALARRVEFQVKLPGTWGLAWAFSCPDGLPGSLVVTENDSTGHDDPAIEASGPVGRGISWTVGNPGHQSMRIVSGCPWTVRVSCPGRTADGPSR